eukprot:COSAG06_NODE_66996_length_253_cov_0.649351_2_plen_35_part_01
MSNTYSHLQMKGSDAKIPFQEMHSEPYVSPGQPVL